MVWVADQSAAAAVEGADPHPEPFGDRVEPGDVHGVAERDDLVLLRVRGGATAPVRGKYRHCTQITRFVRMSLRLSPAEPSW